MKGLKYLLLIVLALSVLGFAGCDKGPKIPDTDYVVAFDKNGGTDPFDMTNQYVNAGGALIEPGHKDYPGITHGEITKPGYILDGWYTGTKADDGTVTFDKKWNFATDRVSSSFTLYAKWVKRLTFTTHYVVDGATSDKTAVAYAEEGGAFRFVSPKWTGYTFMGYKNDDGVQVNGYYLDEACTQPIVFDASGNATNLSHPGAGENNETENVNVYAMFMEGNYRLVRKASDMTSMLAGANYYLMNDVDFKDVTVSGLAEFTGKIIGNGYKIRNLTITHDLPGQAITWFGLFGRLKGSAEISAVTFENCKLEVTLIHDKSQGYNIGFLAGEMSAESKIENVTITNCAVTIIKSDNLTKEPTIRQSGIANGTAEQITGVTGEANIEIKEEGEANA